MFRLTISSKGVLQIRCWIVVLIFVASCGLGVSPSRTKAEEISPDKASFVFYAPGLQDGVFERVPARWGQVTSGRWVREYPVAVVYHHILQSPYEWPSGQGNIKEIMSKLTNGEATEFGPRSVYNTNVGSIVYRTFSTRSDSCVGFFKEYGSRRIQGLYCDSNPLSEERVKAVLDGLGIRGRGQMPQRQNSVTGYKDGKRDYKCDTAACESGPGQSLPKELARNVEAAREIDESTGPFDGLWTGLGESESGFCRNLGALGRSFQAFELEIMVREQEITGRIRGGRTYAWKHFFVDASILGTVNENGEFDLQVGKNKLNAELVIRGILPKDDERAKGKWNTPNCHGKLSLTRKSYALPDSSLHAVLKYPKVGTTATWECTGPYGNKRTYKVVRVENGIIRTEGYTSGRGETFVEESLLGIGTTLSKKRDRADGMGVRGQQYNDDDFKGYEKLVPGSKFSGPVREWHNRASWEWDYTIEVGDPESINHKVFGEIQVVPVFEKRTMVSGNYKSETRQLIYPEQGIELSITYKDGKRDYKCDTTAYESGPGESLSEELARKAVAAIDFDESTGPFDGLWIGTGTSESGTCRATTRKYGRLRSIHVELIIRELEITGRVTKAYHGSSSIGVDASIRGIASESGKFNLQFGESILGTELVLRGVVPKEGNRASGKWNTPNCQGTLLLTRKSSY